MLRKRIEITMEKLEKGDVLLILTNHGGAEHIISSHAEKKNYQLLKTIRRQGYKEFYLKK